MEDSKVLKEIEDKVKKKENGHYKDILHFNQMVHESKTRRINTLIHKSKKGIKV